MSQAQMEAQVAFYNCVSNRNETVLDQLRHAVAAILDAVPEGIRRSSESPKYLDLNTRLGASL